MKVASIPLTLQCEFGVELQSGKGEITFDYAAFRTCEFLLPSFAHIVSQKGRCKLQLSQTLEQNAWYAKSKQTNVFAKIYLKAL